MKKFAFFQKNKKTSDPLWSKEVYGKWMSYLGEDIDTFLKLFDHIEDEIIQHWHLNKLSWKDYERAITEVLEAKQSFVQFAYN